MDDRFRQIMGVLHGGASAALAESVGSFAAVDMCVDHKRVMCVGQEDQCQPSTPGGERYP